MHITKKKLRNNIINDLNLKLRSKEISDYGATFMLISDLMNEEEMMDIYGKTKYSKKDLFKIVKEYKLEV